MLLVKGWPVPFATSDMMGRENRITQITNNKILLLDTKTMELQVIRSSENKAYNRTGALAYCLFIEYLTY